MRITGFMARPSAKTSIGKVFQDRAARYADKVFIKFDDQQLTYRQANETVNRYAAVLAARGVGARRRRRHHAAQLTASRCC